jgi:hypothetical protein
MKTLRILAPFFVLIAQAGAAAAQQDEAPQDTTLDLSLVMGDDESGGLTLTSGKTYNRIEGLPILFGPTFRSELGAGDLSLAALGIIRTAHSFHWDSENIGHRLTADLRFGRRRGFAVGAESFDVVSKIEPWQLAEPDGGLAAFFLKRDYFDWFGRHGARIYASAFRGNASATIGYSDERWSSRRARDVYSLFRGDDSWRANPVINDGRAHVATLSLHLDTRNSSIDPLAGWFIDTQYERGSGDFQTDGTMIEPEYPDGRAHLDYGRAFLDIRRYNRISQKRRLNARLVIGGWLHGDPLPYQRRFSVGGIGTLPGFDFRRVGIGTDVGQCSSESAPPADRPAECERVALAQVEYRQELPSELFDVFNRNRIRVRGAVFRVRPEVVAFADAGRGWLVGPGDGDLTYKSGSLPGFDTFRTDVGVGLDLGIAGIYVAKAVSESKEPANFFVRISSRF